MTIEISHEIYVRYEYISVNTTNIFNGFTTHSHQMALSSKLHLA